MAVHFRAHEHLSAAAFEALPANTRFGLSFDDFQRLQGKYGVIAASPIVDDNGRYRGCVTADFPIGGQHGTIQPDLVLESLVMAARLVVDAL